MSADRDITAIEVQAADWMVERDRGLSAARQRELTRWLRADDRHAAVFSALEATWELIGESRAGASGAARPATSRRVRPAWFPITLAAAAAVAVSVAGWGRLAHSRPDPAAAFALSRTTEIGQVRRIDLPDGSVIQLNTNSAADIRFTDAERRVKLARGEAHFSVARNPGPPFIVSVAGVDVRVVGTVFNVRLRSEAVDVVVTEGKVRVDSPGQAASGVVEPAAGAHHSELTAGQKLSVGLASSSVPVAEPTEVSTAEIKQILAWQDRRLDFDAAPLGDIVNEINRYNRHQLVIVDPRLREQRFGGSFPAGDYETFVRMLESSFGVVADRQGNETRLRARAP